MNTGNQRTALSAAVDDDLEPFKHQHLKEQGRTNSPVGVVYDCEQKTVQVWRRKKIGQWSLTHINQLAN